MKILVSAFACSPYQGSEPGVGWNAVKQIATDHEVFVICDEHAREPMERAMAENLLPPNVKVRFTGKLATPHANRMIARLQSWKVYRDFTQRVLQAANAWHEEIGFDLCHQVTVASFRVPSPLWRLPIPFVWGPIGGAGSIPVVFRSMLSPTARAFEKVRDLSTTLALRSKAFSDCIRNTTVLVAANDETANFLKLFRRDRPTVEIPVMSLAPERITRYQDRRFSPPDHGPIRIFAGGSLIGSKGLNLALRALALAKQQGVDFHYTIAGGGSELESLKRISQQLGLESNVTFHPGFRDDEYVRVLQSHHVFLLPSFRETLGITMIEAVIAGCYPIVADISAPGEIVRRSGGIAVKVDTQEHLIQSMADAIVWCHHNRSLLHDEAAKAGRSIVDYFSAERYRRLLNTAYQTAMAQGKPVTPLVNP